MKLASHPEPEERQRDEQTQQSRDPLYSATFENASPTPGEDPAPVEPARRVVLNRIAGDVVNRATAPLTDRERSAIRRLHAYYIENDLSIREVAKLVRLSETAISQIFNGKYGAKLDGAIKEIESFFRLADSRALGRRLPFTETDLTQRIFQVCEAAREFQKIAFIFSDAQIGKSTALEEYTRRNNHGSTLYSYIPAGASFTNFMFVLAAQLRIPLNTSIARMRQRVLDSFDDRMLLIVDEAHQAVESSRKSGIQCVEFIRELFNAKKCGVVICATNAFRNEMDNGGLHKILCQTKRRRLCTLQLPNVPTQADLDKFAAAYGLAPSTGEFKELENGIVEKEALGMWLTLLRVAAKLAAERNQPMSWQHVQLADAVQKKLENKPF